MDVDQLLAARAEVKDPAIALYVADALGIEDRASTLARIEYPDPLDQAAMIEAVRLALVDARRVYELLRLMERVDELLRRRRRGVPYAPPLYPDALTLGSVGSVGAPVAMGGQFIYVGYIEA